MTHTDNQLVRNLRALPRPVWVLFLGTFLNKFGNFVIPFLSVYLISRGYTVADAGLAIGAYGLGTLLALGIGGQMADSFGRRNTIIVSMFSTAAAMLLLSQARGLPVIMLATLFTGLTGELYRPACSALLADLVPADQRVTAFSAYRMSFNAGWAFGPAAAGFLAGHSFLWLFLGDAATSALFGVVAVTALPHGRRAAAHDQGWRPALRAMSRDGRFLRAVAASFLISLVFFQMVSTFSVHVTGQGFAPWIYGSLVSLNGLLVVLFELPLTLITQVYPPRRVMATGYVLAATGFATLAWAGTLPALILAVVMFTLGEMVTMPVGSAYVAGLAPAQYRGRYAGAMGVGSSVALVIGPGLGMAAYSLHPVGMWLGCGVLGLTAALIITSGNDQTEVPRDNETP